MRPEDEDWTPADDLLEGAREIGDFERKAPWKVYADFASGKARHYWKDGKILKASRRRCRQEHLRAAGLLEHPEQQQPNTPHDERQRDSAG